MEEPKISIILIPPFLTIFEKVFGFFFLVLFWFLFPFFERETGEGDSLSSLGVSKLLIQFSPPATVPGNRGKTLNLQLPKRGRGLTGRGRCL